MYEYNNWDTNTVIWAVSCTNTVIWTVGCENTVSGIVGCTDTVWLFVHPGFVHGPGTWEEMWSVKCTSVSFETQRDVVYNI